MKLTMWKKVLVVLGVVAATLCYWEIGVRVITSRTVPLLRTDPQFGGPMHVKNYSGKAWDAISGRKNNVRTNRLGYIGDDIKKERATGTIRIAMLGDSTLEGLQVDLEETFPHILENQLTKDGFCASKKFEVMNFGMGSAGTYYETQIYKRDVTPFHPDYVMLVFHNDYEENLSKFGHNFDIYPRHSVVGLRSFLSQFELTRFVFYKLRGNEEFVYVLKKIGLLASDAEISPVEPVVVATTTPGLSQAHFDRTFELLDKLNASVTENGSRFVVVIFPQEVDYAGVGTGSANPRTKKLSEHLSSVGITHIDSTMALARLKNNTGGACLSFGCVDHLNEEGHRAMASILNKFTLDLLRQNNSCNKQ